MTTAWKPDYELLLYTVNDSVILFWLRRSEIWMTVRTTEHNMQWSKTVRMENDRLSICIRQKLTLWWYESLTAKTYWHQSSNCGYVDASSLVDLLTSLWRLCTVALWCKSNYYSTFQTMSVEESHFTNFWMLHKTSFVNSKPDGTNFPLLPNDGMWIKKLLQMFIMNWFINWPWGLDAVVFCSKSNYSTSEKTMRVEDLHLMLQRQFYFTSYANSERDSTARFFPLLLNDCIWKQNSFGYLKWTHFWTDDFRTDVLTFYHTFGCETIDTKFLILF